MSAKALIVDVLYGSKIALQSLGLVTQTAIKRRKAKSTFKKTLVQQGIPVQIANEIAKEYPNPIAEILSLIKNNAGSWRKS
jgi:hypothetical protein